MNNNIQNSNKGHNLSPEQIKQLMELHSQGALPNMKQKQTELQKILSKLIAFFQKGVILLDRFIDLAAKPESKGRNDVVQSARTPILFGLYIIIIFIIIGGIWAATAPLNSATIAIGTVVANTNKKVIQHFEGGIIKNIFVKQGDVVSEGDKLVEIDDTRIKSEHDNILYQYRVELATENRLIAERDELPNIQFNDELLSNSHLPNVEKIINTQEKLFKSKSATYRAKKESLKQKLSQLDKQIQGLEAKKLSLHKQFDVEEDRLNAAQVLFQKNFIQKAKLLELESRVSDTKTQIAVNDIEIAKTKQDITRTDIEILNLQNESQSQILAELKETQKQVGALREKLISYKDSLERSIIKAPVDGVINTIQYHTIGGVIRQGESILEISPLNDVLIIEAKVPSRSIDVVHVGLKAKIRFSAFKSRIAPMFNGVVVSLSPDIVQDRSGAMPMDKKQMDNSYIARIEIDYDDFNKFAQKKNVKLHPGMQAEVQIINGSRTLLGYLLDPVTDIMFKSFREK